MKEIIATPDAPPALGPYSQAVKINDMIFVSGQLPIDPRSGQIVGADIRAQADRVLQNIQAILMEGEASLKDVVKVTVFLADIADFDEMNKIYGVFFPFHETSTALPPARSTVEVSKLPRGARIEIDVIAVISHDRRDLEIF